MIRRRYPIARVGRRKRREIEQLTEFRTVVSLRAAGLCEGQEAGICRGFVHHGSHAHHVASKARGGSNEPENGLWLCAEAHDWVHAHPAQATELQLMRSR